MSWRFPRFGSQQQQTDPNFQDIPTQSWYPPSVVGSSSRPSTPTSSSASPHQRASDHPQSSSRGQPSPAEAAVIIARLKDKRAWSSGHSTYAIISRIGITHLDGPTPH